MKSVKIGLLAVLVSAGGALASTPPSSHYTAPSQANHNTLSVDALNQALGARAQQKPGMAVASMATSCKDPQPWYWFSGIEIATCLYTHQW